jgi:signal transduction histidine kinase
MPPDRIPNDARDAAMVAWIHGFAPYGVITTDNEFRVQSWNHWMETRSGKEAGSVIGQDLFKIYPDLADRSLVPRFQRALTGEVSVLSTALHGYLFRLLPSVRDESFPHMQQTARIAPLRHGQETIGTIIVVEDVTEREVQAHLLRRQHDRDTILSWALAHLLASLHPRQSIRDLFCKIVEHYDWDTYLLYLRNPDGKTLKLHGAGGLPPEAESRLSLLDGTSDTGKMLFDLPKPVALEHLDTSKETIFGPALGFRTCVLIPLIAGEDNLGTFCFATRTRDTLQDGELDLLSTIGQYLAVALNKEATTLKLHSAQEKLSRHASDLEKQVNDRTVKLRDTITELETFSHSIAHDLRAPIRAMRGYCEALAEDFSAVLPDEAANIINRLSGACIRLDNLTKDLLTFAKVSRQEVELVPVDLESLISEVLALNVAAPGTVTVRRPVNNVLGQRTLLQQCLANLIDNAAKFVAEGMAPDILIYTEKNSPDTETIARSSSFPFTSARLREKEPSTAEKALRAGGRVRIFIEDKGIGIDHESHGKIFGIFERANQSGKYPGTGMGLAIVARAMQRMGGACGVESEPGVGSRFWLDLPAAP